MASDSPFSGYCIARLRLRPDRAPQWFVLLYDQGQVREAHPCDTYVAAVRYFQRKAAP